MHKSVLKISYGNDATRVVDKLKATSENYDRRSFNVSCNDLRDDNCESFTVNKFQSGVAAQAIFYDYGAGEPILIWNVFVCSDVKLYDSTYLPPTEVGRDIDESIINGFAIDFDELEALKNFIDSL